MPRLGADDAIGVPAYNLLHNDSLYLLSASEVSANLYCNSREGVMIICGYLWGARYISMVWGSTITVYLVILRSRPKLLKDL